MPFFPRKKKPRPPLQKARIVGKAKPFMGHVVPVENQNRKYALEAQGYVAIRLQAPPEGMSIRDRRTGEVVDLEPNKEFHALLTPTDLARPFFRALKHPEDLPEPGFITDLLD